MRRVNCRRLVSFAILTIIVVFSLGSQNSLAQGSAGVIVEDWSKRWIGETGIPDGWRGQQWGSPKYNLTIIPEGPSRVLRLISNNESSTIAKEVKVDVKRYPLLQWQWKIVKLPRGGDSRHKDTDDMAAHIHVVFPRFPSAVRSRIVGYVWDTTAPVGTITKSEKTGTVTYVVVRSGSSDLGKWLTETRNVYEDYKRIYGELPGEQIGAIALQIDSNETKSSAESFFGKILFR